MFGTPTLALGDGQVVFVKLDAVPTGGRWRPLWETVGDFAEGLPELWGWQRVTQPLVAG